MTFVILQTLSYVPHYFFQLINIVLERCRDFLFRIFQCCRLDRWNLIIESWAPV